MSVTMTLTDIGVLVMAAASVVAAVALTRFAARAVRTAEELDHAARRLVPRVDGTLEELQSELRALRDVTRNLDGITGHANRVAGSVAETAIPLIQDVEQLRRGRKYVVAAAKGVRAGVRTWNDKHATKGDEHE
ncbi:MAG: hypothetical protein HKN12_06540 [Gemmatimonadetes bacterium]|nr:hypothetical protein [Gemmatimonadota bacterium]